MNACAAVPRPRLLVCLLAGCLGLLSLPGSAQTRTNVFGIYPDATDGTSRSGLSGTSSGDVLLEVRGRSFDDPANVNGNTGADFTGIGDIATGASAPGAVDSFIANLQDQEGRTIEPFDFVIVAEDPAVPGAPGTPPAGNPLGPAVLLRTAPLTLPSSTGQAAWQITSYLATPAAVLPAADTFYFGVGLPANASWSADGLSVHLACFYGSAPFTCADHPRPGVVSLAQARDVTGGALVPRTTSQPHTHALWLGTPGAVLHFGADIVEALQTGPNPAFGAAGNYPDACGTTRSGFGDGLAIRHRDAGTPDGATALWLSTGFSPSPLYVGFTRGGIVLDPSALLAFGTGRMPTSGELVLTLVGASAAAPLCPLRGSRIHGQGLTLDLANATVVLTNGVSASF